MQIQQQNHYYQGKQSNMSSQYQPGSQLTSIEEQQPSQMVEPTYATIRQQKFEKAE